MLSVGWEVEKRISDGAGVLHTDGAQQAASDNRIYHLKKQKAPHLIYVKK